MGHMGMLSYLLNLSVNLKNKVYFKVEKIFLKFYSGKKEWHFSPSRLNHE